MCLVGIAWQAHPRYPLIVAANRDEFHGRPAAPADWWPDNPEVYGGRDLTAGGTWLGLTRRGRLGLVTNRHMRPPGPATTLSRGALVRDWLTGSGDPGSYLDALEPMERHYAGFSLVIADRTDARGFTAPVGDGFHRWWLGPGVLAFSNGGTDGPWPKVTFLEATLRALLSRDEVTPGDLLTLLATRSPVGPVADDSPRSVARATPFVTGAEFGTRSSTAILISHDGHARFVEQRFGPGGVAEGESSSRFHIEP